MDVSHSQPIALSHEQEVIIILLLIIIIVILYTSKV